MFSSTSYLRAPTSVSAPFAHTYARKGSVLRPRSHSSRRIAVFGVVPSLTWSVTRCLTRAGFQPIVFGWHKVCPVQLVPGCSYVPLRGVTWVGGELAPSTIHSLNKACVEYKIEQLLPIDFPSITLLSRHGEAFTAARVSAVPNAMTLKTLHNKWQFSQIAKRLDIPQPETELAQSADELLNTRLQFPIITKPVDRWASVGFQIHKSRSELMETVNKNALGCEFPMLVQEFIPGEDVGFAFIARRGKLVAHAAFKQTRPGHRRYFDSPQLRWHVARLIADTGYHGVGEVDARFNPRDQSYSVLEVNPRFWASMLYAAHAGMNFPELMVNLNDLNDGTGFLAKKSEVTLSPYEFAMGKAMHCSEKVHSAVNRWRGI